MSPPKKQGSKGGKKEVRMLKASKNQEDKKTKETRISFLITLPLGSGKFVSCQFSSLGVLSVAHFDLEFSVLTCRFQTRLCHPLPTRYSLINLYSDSMKSLPQEKVIHRLLVPKCHIRRDQQKALQWCWGWRWWKAAQPSAVSQSHGLRSSQRGLGCHLGGRRQSHQSSWR